MPPPQTQHGLMRQRGSSKRFTRRAWIRRLLLSFAAFTSVCDALFNAAAADTAGLNAPTRFIEKVHPSNLAASANFGSALADGLTFLGVGAPNDRNETGSVFVYDTATEPARLLFQIAPPELSTGR